MNIRPFCAEDLDAIMHIVDVSTDDRYTHDFFLGLWEVAPKGFLVANINEVVVGFILAVLTDIGTLRILMVCVAPKYRKQGIASVLIGAAIHMHEANTIYLEVKTINKTAISLYQRHGFEIAEVLFDFYPDGSNAYRMEKKMSE